MQKHITDYLIIGAGIIGLTTAYYLKRKYPNKSIMIIDKESDVAKHASGRNSGVLHAGLYYANDSLRAKFCVAGSKTLRDYSLKNNIQLNQCGKVIVATDSSQIQQLKDLYQLALKNGVECDLVDEKQLDEIEPTAKTSSYAIYSPNTASFDAIGICNNLYNKLKAQNVEFKFNTQYIKQHDKNTIITNNSIIEYTKLINCAGMYADKIAQNFDLIKDYTLIPFKGIFLYCHDTIGNYKRHIYPLPDVKLKLLGVHFSPEHNGNIKLGPTAIPCISRENYKGLDNIKFNEMKEIVTTQFKLFVTNSFNFRDLAIAEFKKQSKSGLIKHGTDLVKNIKQFQFSNWGVTGIQPRLYNMKKQEIMDDFLIEATDTSVHVINSVSPAFSASFAFSEYLVNTYL